MSYSSFSKATQSEQENAGFLKMTGCAIMCKCFDLNMCVWKRDSTKTAFKRDKYALVSYANTLTVTVFSF